MLPNHNTLEQPKHLSNCQVAPLWRVSILPNTICWTGLDCLRFFENLPICLKTPKRWGVVISMLFCSCPFVIYSLEWWIQNLKSNGKEYWKLIILDFCIILNYIQWFCPELAILPLSTMIFFQHGIDPHTPLRDWYFGTSFREKYDECLRKTAEVHGEMLKGWGYRLKRIHKATPNGFQRRLQRPSWCRAGGGIFWGKKVSFHIFYLFEQGIWAYMFSHILCLEDKVQKNWI